MPLLFVTCIILRFTGEVRFFSINQNRFWQRIKIIKFATMLKESPNIETRSVTLKNDPRVLPVGKLLRKAKINELPQLINVLRGEMSIIGPRPQTKRCFDAYSAKDKVEIMKVVPGLSGLGSILFRNEDELLDYVQTGERYYDEVIMPFEGKLRVGTFKIKGFIILDPNFCYCFIIFGLATD